jgi:hypothetical protein
VLLKIQINHWAKECCFTRNVWNLVCNWLGYNLSPYSWQDSPISDWWESLIHLAKGDIAKKKIGALLTTWWHVWLERNRRIFHQQCQSELQVAYTIKENTELIELSRQA